MSGLPEPARAVLDRGSFCHLVATTALGPHATPTVFAIAGGRLWFTTSRRSVKARALRRDPRVGGVVRSGRDAVVFSGEAFAHDLLEPGSWPGSALRAPLVSFAAARFTRKNARFFAGYAVDAGRVPLAWTPPGRVFVEVGLRRTALIRDGVVVGRWGEWPAPAHEPGGFRAVRSGAPPLEALPARIVEALPMPGAAALATVADDGPVVVPVAWTAHGAALYAVGREEVVGLAGSPSGPGGAALVIDRPSTWRARDMLGVMIRGAARVHPLRTLSSGAASARAVAASAGVEDEDATIVRVRPERIVWWHGWDSGTVAAS